MEHGNQYSLKFIYEHSLTRTAYNMCKGSFGGGGDMQSSANDYLCVQSMDGMLSIYEYESHSLTCFLPKCLLPGPLKYIARTDSFVTVSSSWQLESYKYQSLALTAKTVNSSSSRDEGKRVLPDFSYNLGEPAIDIDVHGQCIIVLGERNLFCFTEMCALKYMKKFDFNPSAFCVYGNGGGSDSSIQFLIATHSKLLFVHQVGLNYILNSCNNAM